MEKNNLEETVGTELFRDAHAHVTTDLDAILSGSIVEAKELKENTSDILDDIETALCTPGVWGVEFVGDDCICFRTEESAREYFDSLTVDDISLDGEGIELFKVLDAEGNTETVEVISVYDDDDYEESYEDVEESCENKLLSESYRRIVSRGNSLVDNPLFVDFD